HRQYPTSEMAVSRIARGDSMCCSHSEVSTAWLPRLVADQRPTSFETACNWRSSAAPLTARGGENGTPERMRVYRRRDTSTAGSRGTAGQLELWQPDDGFVQRRRPGDVGE